MGARKAAFSKATHLPCQAGLGHVNEQPHEYVIGRMEDPTLAGLDVPVYHVVPSVSEERGLEVDVNSYLRPSPKLRKLLGAKCSRPGCGNTASFLGSGRTCPRPSFGMLR